METRWHHVTRHVFYFAPCGGILFFRCQSAGGHLQLHGFFGMGEKTNRNHRFGTSFSLGVRLPGCSASQRGNRGRGGQVETVLVEDSA